MATCLFPLPDQGAGDALGSESLEIMFAKLWNDHSILVPNGGSIQEAVDAAQSGAVIIVEAGQYDEEVGIDRSDITLVGIPSAAGSTVELTYGVTGRIGHKQVINIRPGREGYAPYRCVSNQFSKSGGRGLRRNSIAAS